MEVLGKCIVTGDDITSNNNSKAHVIPSALGGRLKPKGILSIKGNGILDDKFDFPLIDAFQALMNLLGGSRDSGDNPPTRMTDADGREYAFLFGESLTPTRPEYTEEQKGEETHISIKARNLKELRTLLGKVKKKNPNFDIDEAMGHAVSQHVWPDSPLHIGLDLGPRILFPWTFAAAAVFASYHGQQRHPAFNGYVDDFDLSQPTLPPDTFYFMPEKPFLQASGEITHILALVGDPSTRTMLFYAELFNAFAIGVTWPYEGDAQVCKTYAVDIISGKEIPAQVDINGVKSLPWASTHILGDADLYTRSKARMDQILHVAVARQWENQLDEVTTRAWGPADGRQLNLEDQIRLLEEWALFIEHIWTNPAVTSEIRQEMIAAFEDILSEMVSKLPPSIKSAFALLCQPLANQLRKRNQQITAKENTGSP